MSRTIGEEIEALLRCPHCRHPLARRNDASYNCSNAQCAYHAQGFPSASGQPVLIDFENSIFDPKQLSAPSGALDTRLVEKRGPKALLHKLRRGLLGSNRIATAATDYFLHHFEALPEARILVIGGGTIGNGMEKLYDAPSITIIGTDVYASPYTITVADGHSLPFADGAFDGVWIQAVLEHVLEPEKVVAEIHRVLKPGGIVYADTPFMQQVHEEAYDFQRFTLGGHRWLFRKFDLLAAGTVKGVGTSLIWSIRYFVRAITGSNSIGGAASLAFFWLRFFDKFGAAARQADGASGVYFLGTKSETELHPRDIVDFYYSQWKYDLLAGDEIRAKAHST